MRNFGYEEDGYVKSAGDWRLWKRIGSYISQHRFTFSGAVVISLIITGATLAQPWLMQIGIDSFITNDSVDIQTRLTGLTSTATWYALMVLLVFGFGFSQIILLEYIGQSIMHTIRQDLFKHILRLDLPFFNATPTGRLVTRLTNDIQNMHEMFTSVLVTMFNDILRLVGILVALYLMNVRLALIMSIFVPISLFTTVVFAKLAREKFRAIRSQLAKINSFLSETLAGISILQIFNRQNHTSNQFDELNRGYLKRSLAQIRLFGAFMPITEFMGSAAVALILWYGGKEIIGEQLTVGELVAFLSYMRLFFQPLRELSQKFSIVQSAMASAERIFQLQDTKPQIEEQEKTVGKSTFNGEVTFENISFGYSHDEPVITDLTLTLPAGKTIALVGTTGSGKTTLVNLLLRFYDVDQGTISIDTVPLSEFSLKHLRSLVGVVLQDTLILQDSLLSNITMESGKSRSEIEHLMQKTGMQRFIDKLPDGLDTQIGDGGQELSTGEKQLLSFARILCRDPRVLILDEATAAIDTESENILEDAITDIFAGRTSLIIAHRLSTIRRADYIVVMQNGRIVEQGKHQELMDDKGRYYELVSLDLKE